MSAVPNPITALREQAREEGRAAITAHHRGDFLASQQHLENERQLIEQLRRVAPELDLSKEHS